jgi:Raf kinase inhibitor-like YbhB/YbcL family protein
MLVRASILAIAVAFVVSCLALPARAQNAFALSSSSVNDGARLDVKYGGNSKASPNCVGENVSPALSWVSPPEGTKSFALVFFDPDGRPPAGATHLAVYGIPLSVTGFAEGELSKQSDKFVSGQNAFKLTNYMGPCPPAGTPHHYVFTLMATDLEPSALKEGMTREELASALDGHVKRAAGLFATFQHP